MANKKPEHVKRALTLKLSSNGANNGDATVGTLLSVPNYGAPDNGVVVYFAVELYRATRPCSFNKPNISVQAEFMPPNPNLQQRVRQTVFGYRLVHVRSDQRAGYIDGFGAIGVQVVNRAIPSVQAAALNPLPAGSTARLYEVEKDLMCSDMGIITACEQVNPSNGTGLGSYLCSNGLRSDRSIETGRSLQPGDSVFVILARTAAPVQSEALLVTFQVIAFVE